MNMNALILKIISGLAILAACLTIIQIWAPFISAAVFWKLMATLGIIALLGGFLMVVKLDFSEHKNLKDQNYID